MPGRSLLLVVSLGLIAPAALGSPASGSDRDRAPLVEGRFPFSVEAAQGAAPCGLKVGEHGTGYPDYSYYVRPEGALRAILLLVDFPTTPATEDAATVGAMFDAGAEQWFSAASYGRFSMSIDVPAQWFRMPRPWADYRIPHEQSAESFHRYVNDAVRAADATVDFSSYQGVYVVPAAGTNYGTSWAWIGWGQHVVQADGATLRFGSILGDIRGEGVWNTLAHETGHDFGLPDLYEYAAGDYFEAARPTGGWDLMGLYGEGHLLAWNQRLVGWLDEGQLACVASRDETVTLSPLSVVGGLKAAVVRTGRSRAYVVENRQQTGLDAVLCDKGALVYSVDTATPSGQRAIVVHPAGQGSDQALLDRCGPKYDAPLDLGAGETARFRDQALGVTIEVVSVAGDAYTVRIQREEVLKLRVSSRGPGSVRSKPSGISCGRDCGATLAAGDEITLRAKPFRGSRFKGWRGGCGGSSRTCTLFMEDAAKVTAVFGD